VDDYVSTDQWFSGGNNFYSIIVWFRLNQYPNESQEVIWQHRADWHDKFMYITTYGGLEVNDRHGGTRVFFNHDISVDTWYHAVFTANNDSLKLYINSMKVASAERTFNTDWDASYIGSSIGGGGFGTYGFSDVNISEMSVWNTALSESEIQSYMVTSPTADEEGLVSYWNFNEGTG
ncbi:uncharacterized protein METZ01_LOCUS406361, partial [marine metagenome]